MFLACITIYELCLPCLISSLLPSLPLSRLIIISILIYGTSCTKRFARRSLLAGTNLLQYALLTFWQSLSHHHNSVSLGLKCAGLDCSCICFMVEHSFNIVALAAAAAAAAAADLDCVQCTATTATKCPIIYPSSVDANGLS